MPERDLHDLRRTMVTMINERLAVCRRRYQPAGGEDFVFPVRGLGAGGLSMSSAL